MTVEEVNGAESSEGGDTKKLLRQMLH